ncbi:MAG: response regulator [Pseudomonadales bacterium]
MSALGISLAPALLFTLFAALFIGLLANTLWLRNRYTLLLTVYALLMSLQLPQLINAAPDNAGAGLWRDLAAVAAMLSAGLFVSLVQQNLPALQLQQSRKFVRILQRATLLLAIALCAWLVLLHPVRPPGNWLLAPVALLYCSAFVLALWQYAVAIRYVGPLALASTGCGLFALRIIVGDAAAEPGAGNSHTAGLLLWLEACSVTMLATLLQGAGAEKPGPKHLNNLQHRQKVATLAPLINASRHELRAPLTDIIGLADLIGDQPLDRQQRDHLVALQDTARKALYNINDLFSYRAQGADSAGHSSLHAEYFQPEIFIEECCQYFRQQVDAGECDLVVDMHPEVPLSLQANVHILRQSMLLILEFLLAEKRVKKLFIEAELAGPDCLSIIFFTGDRGNPEQMDRATLDSDSSLATAFTLVRENSATLSFARRENDKYQKHKPDPAYVVLQLGFPIQIAPRDLQQAISADSLSGCRALVVEDSATARAVIEAYLQRWNMQVHAAATAAEARALLLNQAALDQRVDVVIVDYKLPDGTGLELVAALLREAAMTPMPALIMVSNSINTISARSARNHGIHHILEKPVLAESLKLTLVESLLLQSALRAESTPTTRNTTDAQTDAAEKPRALLVEDDPISQTVTSAQLAQCGWTCDSAGNGKTGIARFREFDYDLVILDCSLPDIPGLEVAKKMLALERSRDARKDQHVFIVSLSSDNAPQLAKRSAAAGLDAHWVKPVTRADLEKIKRN